MRALPAFFHRLRARVGLPALLLALTVPALRMQPAAAPDPIVELPPFMVEERGIPLKWHYYAAPGLEVLAACDPGLAANIVQRTMQLNAMMPVFLPARFLPVTAMPETMILVDADVGQSQAREAMADAMKRGGVRFMPNLRLADTDMSAVFAAVTPMTPKNFAYTPERMAALLAQRTPRLPDWFVEGMDGFYRQMKFNDGDIAIGVASWISKEESQALRDDPARPRVLWPMAEFLAHRKDPSPVASGTEATWRAQATLFIRWAMLENNGALREALWSFVDRLEREPASEALFRECFGRGYADMRDELSDYLTKAVSEDTTIRAPLPPGQSPSRPKFRPATDLEVACLRGDWERLEIAYVRGQAPEVADNYVTQARKTLARAFDRGLRDPRLLATMGLTEIDAGNLDDARVMLEEAVAGKVVRPRVYFELARLRYAAIARAIGPQAKLNAAQVAEVLGPLSEGQRQNPPLLENYTLFSEVVGRSIEPPTAAHLAALHEGALTFPHATELVVRTIYFHLVSDQPAAAASLTEAGLRATRDPAMRAKFERASASLSGAKKRD